MAISASFPLFLLISLLIFNCNGKTDESSDQKVYIVYMGDRPKGDFSAAAAQHKSMLHTSLGSDRAGESWALGYTATRDERHKISRQVKVERSGLRLFPNTKYKLPSWASLRMSFGLNPGVSRMPTKWKGGCQSTNFTKIIGAKYYCTDGTITPPEVTSLKDTDGHGTHTAFIAAGASVPGASLYGLAAGTARGGVPSARIAVYKVCWVDDCYGSDILAAFDDAIADGVDIGYVQYADDLVAIGAFHALKNGILTSASTGNDRPDNINPVSNNSPWHLTVATYTSMDMKFVSNVQLGNNKIFEVITSSLCQELFNNLGCIQF